MIGQSGWRIMALGLIPVLAFAAIGPAQTTKAGKGSKDQKAPPLSPTIEKAWKKSGASSGVWVGLGKGVFSSVQFESSPDSLRDGVPGFTLDTKRTAKMNFATVPVPETPFGLVAIGDLPPAKVAELKRFPTLTYLSLHLTDNATTCPGLGDLSALRGLDISALGGTDKLFLNEITRLKNLTRLGLYHGEYTDATFAALAKMNKLESLGLRSLPFTPARMAQVGKLTQLKALSLDGFASAGDVNGQSLGISASAFAAVGSLKELDSLRLYDIGIGPDHLATVAKLPKLTELQIVNEKISDEAAAKLQGAKSLKRLLVYKTMSPAAIGKLKSAIPGLKVE